MALFANTEKTTSFENTGRQEIVPDGTELLLNIAGVSVEPAASFPSGDSVNEHVKILLHSVGEGKYKDFMFNHKLHINDNDSKKRDRALKFLMAYDQNCKGDLVKQDEQGVNIIDSLILGRALNGGSIVGTIGLIPADVNRPGSQDNNFIRSIKPANKAANVGSAVQSAPATQQSSLSSDNFDEDIPF